MDVMERDWEAAYQNRDTPWDKGGVAPPLLELVEKEGAGIWGGGPVLVPGCGAGHDVRVIASMGVEVVGVDIAPSAVRLAGEFPAAGREWYERGDFLATDFESGRRYSGLWEHTCFCAIPPSRRDDYARSAARILAEGGLLAGVFYLNPWDPGEDEAGPPFGVDVESVKRHFEPWFDFEKGWVPERSYPGREGREWIGLFRRLSNQNGL